MADPEEQRKHEASGHATYSSTCELCVAFKGVGSGVRRAHQPSPLRVCEIFFDFGLFVTRGQDGTGSNERAPVIIGAGPKGEMHCR